MIITAVGIVAGMGLGAGIILTVASKIMYVPVNEQIEKLREALPGANCGACGFAGCDDYANALGEEGEYSVSPTLCPVGGSEVSNKLAEILGVVAEDSAPRVAFVKCGGATSSVKKIINYDKVKSCAAAEKLCGGSMECTYGCIGLGDCARSCRYDAITIDERLASIDPKKCVACGLCVAVCPKQIIEMGEKGKSTKVMCSSQNSALKTKKGCVVGCIGCGKCEKICKFEAIKVENSLAVIDHDKCKDCGQCHRQCPTGAIVVEKKKRMKKN